MARKPKPYVSRGKKHKGSVAHAVRAECPADVPVGINPLTTDVIYTDAEREFMVAVDRYKRRTGCRFPTCREFLHVLLALGYTKG